jgi:hypothetical protein
MTKRLHLRETIQKQKRGGIGGNNGRAGKYPSNTRCPKCGLVYQDGVWKQGVSTGKHMQLEKLCPACLQIREGWIGGIVQCSGAFTDSHRRELLARIRNVEKQTQEERPLERIIRMKENRKGIEVLTTTEHLVARIAKSIHRDFGGELELRYAPEDKFAFAHWHRE